jgi:hypothetical protein
MKWPFVSRKKYEQVIADASADIAGEYQRALIDGRKQVHDWAVEANYNIFNADIGAVKGLAIAAFQQAIGIFSPSKPKHPYWKEQQE